MLVELLHELNVLQLPLVSNIHQRLPSVYINDCHRNGVVDWVEEQEHDSVAIEI